MCYRENKVSETADLGDRYSLYTKATPKDIFLQSRKRQTPHTYVRFSHRYFLLYSYTFCNLLSSISFKNARSFLIVVVYPFPRSHIFSFIVSVLNITKLLTDLIILREYLIICISEHNIFTPNNQGGLFMVYEYARCSTNEHYKTSTDRYGNRNSKGQQTHQFIWNMKAVLNNSAILLNLQRKKNWQTCYYR